MRIAVIGSGIAGLASAAHLARAGHAVTIFERFEAPRPLGAGLLLQPAGLAALDRLGLRTGAQTRGARVSRLLGRTPKGRTVLDLRYADGRPGDIGIGIHRASLFELLLSSAREAGALWRTGAGVVRLQDMRNGRGSTSTPGRRHPPSTWRWFAMAHIQRCEDRSAPKRSSVFIPGALSGRFARTLTVDVTAIWIRFTTAAG